MKNLIISILTASALLSTLAVRADPDTDGDGLQLGRRVDPDRESVPQINTNGDGFGNRCDPDLNNDGVVNFLDFGLFSSHFLPPRHRPIGILMPTSMAITV